MSVIEVMEQVEAQSGMPKIFTRAAKPKPTNADLLAEVENIANDLRTIEEQIRKIQNRMIVVQQKLKGLEGM